MQSNRPKNGAGLGLLLFAIALLLLGIAGLVWLQFFASQKQPEPTKFVLATHTPRPTFTPTVALSPTLQVAVVPTATPIPATSTATPIPSATATATTIPPTSTLTATATPPRPTDTPTPLPPTATPRPPTPTPSPTMPPAKPLRMNSPEYGMQAFLWWRPEVASRDLQMIRAAGFTWVKQDFAWREIEGAGKGKFDWSRTDRIVNDCNTEKLDILARVDRQPFWARSDQAGNGPPDNYQDFADFVFALASRYKGRIRAYEIWNEPNLAREWGGKPPNAAEYVRLLRLAYQAIKRADPNAMVISAGLTPTGTWTAEATPDDMYLDQMYKAMGGRSDGYFDVLGAHAPGYKAPPEVSPDEAASSAAYHNQRFFCFRRVEDLRAIMVRYGDTNKQIAILEFGWTSDPLHPAYSWHRVSEEEKADYMVRAYKWAKEHWSPWIGLMSLIYFCNHDWTEANEEYWWAITYPVWPEFKPRPAYDRLKAMPK